MRLSSLKIRLGKRNEALELLDASKASLQEPHEMMGYAQAYLILGRHREAILLAHNAVRCSSDPEIHMGYVMVFSSADDAVERTAEEIATFQDVLTRFKERFPTSTHFQSFKIDPENPLDAIRETLERHSAHALNVIKAYQDRRMPLPLSVFAKLLGRDLYEVWLHVVSNPNLTLLTASGTEEETQDSLRILNNATGFIADAITLFTFSRLDLLANLESLGDIYIAQATLDQLHELELKRVASDKTMGTIGMIEGKFFLREFTSEELQEMNAGLHTAIAWAEQHARAIGLKEPYTAEDEKWIAVLGDASVETMLIAKQRGLVLLTDDKNYGDLARQNYGTVFVNGAAALLYMHNKGLLSHTRFDKAVLKLAEDGYSFIRIDDNQLFELVASEQFQVTDRVKRVCRVLEQPTVALAGACGAIAGMLRRLYLEPIPDQMRQQLAFYMLDALAKTHAKMDIQRLIRALLRQQMQPLLILQLRQLEEMLDRW
jgi:hypothetical protein